MLSLAPSASGRLWRLSSRSAARSASSGVDVRDDDVAAKRVKRQYRGWAAAGSGVPQLTPRAPVSPQNSPQLVRKRSNLTVAHQRLVSTNRALFVLSAS